MLHKVDFSLPLWRWLFQPIYARLESSVLASGDTLAVLQERITGLLVGDPKFILLVDTDSKDYSKITGHCLLRLQVLPDSTIDAFCEYLFTDSGHGEAFTRACISYVEKEVAKLLPVSSISMLTDENKFKAFKKKYEFQVKKVLMTREIKKVEG